MDAKIAERFHLTAGELDAHRERYEFWHLLRSQEEYAEMVKGDTRKSSREWWDAYQEFIPSGSSGGVDEAENAKTIELLKQMQQH